MGRQDLHSQNRIKLTCQDLGLGDHIQHLGWYKYAQAHQPLHDHSHKDAIEFAYLVKGRQVYRVQNRDYVLSANDVFVTFPNEVHSTANWPEEKGILYWLIIQIPRQQERFLDLPRSETRELTEQLLNLPRRFFTAPPNLAKLFEGIFTTYSAPPAPLKRIVLKGRFLELITSLIAYAGQETTPRACRQINDLLAYIDANLDKPLDIPALADRLALSPSWFKTKFLRHVGMPPAQYILNRKIDRAKQLLRRGEQTVTDIALDLGFSSSGYFATVFKRFTGQNPRDYLPPPSG